MHRTPILVWGSAFFLCEDERTECISSICQAKYIAYELTSRFPPDSVEKLTGALVDAQVEGRA